jgi:N-acetylneuraminate synthase/N,N'-diacetyllegionaminate synthase
MNPQSSPTPALPWAERTYVIAEAGVNHNGEVELAKRLVDAAHAAGADAVKFQTWMPDEIVGRFAQKVDYLAQHTDADEDFFDIAERWRLPYSAFAELKAYCEDVGIQFLSTPDGFQSLDFLVDELDTPFVKVGSTELTHLQFLTAVGRKQRPVIMSTGLGNLGEIETALAALRAGGGPDLPIVVLQCTSEYPAPPEEMNLRAMSTIAAAFGTPVGLSDHSMGFEAAVAAVALGACVIEKHLTLDRAMEGPDHQASADPQALAEQVAAIRRTRVMLGDGLKRPTPRERANMEGIRRSVVAARPLEAGCVLTADDIVCLRPGTGVPPGQLAILIGMRVNRPLQLHEPIRWEDVR